MNAFVVRFVHSIKQERLDHFVVFGTKHLDYLCQEYLAHYHEERPHQGRNNEVLVAASPRKTKLSKSNGELPTLGQIRFRSRLGGLLKSYSRKAV